MKINRKFKKRLKKSAIYQENMFGRKNTELRHIQVKTTDNYYFKYSVKNGIKNNHLMAADNDNFFQRRKIHYLKFKRSR